ncbi:MAG: TetR/AcrR family transcriptional regulator [Opitutae bacterium]|nr:TetR/AcrR family transcriptional regulator [Opitutae bacterium]
MKRKSYHHGKLRAALLSHGVRLLAKEGLAGLSLRKLARQAGVSPAAPYRHFPTARDLAKAIAADGFQLLREATLAALGDPALAALSPLERAGLGYYRFAAANPHHLQLMFSGHVRPEAELPDDPLRQAGEGAFAALMDTIVTEQKAGSVDATVDPSTLAMAVWSFSHGFSTLANAGFFAPCAPDEKTPMEGLVVASQTLLKQGWGAKARPAGRTTARTKK